MFVAMSGGVDSSVAALTLKKSGYDVTGVFMRCYNIDGCAERDAHDARLVANHLDIPFYVFDFEEEYKREVVDYMIRGYRDGVTPNPDVMCNKQIKFGLFLKKALELGADYIATGHYVRLASRHIFRGTDRIFAPAVKSGLDSRRGDTRSARDQARRASETFRSKHTDKLVNFSLLEAKDKNKDQSYFLWTLTQEQLKHCLFPIGDYLKNEVRAVARKAGLPTAEKKDSQGICFLGKVTLSDFLKDYIPRKRGAVLTTAGEKIGEHDGVAFYTIGQRHIGVSSHKPIYVAGKNIKNNALIVADGEENPALYKKKVELKDVNFINPITNYKPPITIYARVRYRQPLASAVLKIENCKLFARGGSVSGGKIEFDKPIKFIAPGQSAVFYKKNGEMLGGGIIYS